MLLPVSGKGLSLSLSLSLSLNPSLPLSLPPSLSHSLSHSLSLGEGRVRAGASEGAETGGLVEERAWGKEECYKKGAEGASEST